MRQGTQRDWFLTVNQFAQSTPVLHTPMRLYAEYGVTLFAAVLLVAWWWARRDQNPRSMATPPSVSASRHWVTGGDAFADSVSKATLADMVRTQTSKQRQRPLSD